jgi:hypothetical protein
LFEKKSYISRVGNKRKYGPLPKGYIEDSIDMADMSIVPNLKKLLVSCLSLKDVNVENNPFFICR